jgi:hypothetical protein
MSEINISSNDHSKLSAEEELIFKLSQDRDSFLALATTLISGKKKSRKKDRKFAQKVINDMELLTQDQGNVIGKIKDKVIGRLAHERY